METAFQGFRLGARGAAMPQHREARATTSESLGKPPVRSSPRPVGGRRESLPMRRHRPRLRSYPTECGDDLNGSLLMQVSIMAHLAHIAKQWECSRIDWTARREATDTVRFYETIGARRIPDKVYFRARSEDFDSFMEQLNG